MNGADAAVHIDADLELVTLEYHGEVAISFSVSRGADDGFEAISISVSPCDAARRDDPEQWDWTMVSRTEARVLAAALDEMARRS